MLAASKPNKFGSFAIATDAAGAPAAMATIAATAGVVIGVTGAAVAGSTLRFEQTLAASEMEPPISFKFPIFIRHFEFTQNSMQASLAYQITAAATKPAGGPSRHR